MKNKSISKRDVLKQVQTKAQAEVNEKKIEMTDDVVLNALFVAVLLLYPFI